MYHTPRHTLTSTLHKVKQCVKIEPHSCSVLPHSSRPFNRARFGGAPHFEIRQELHSPPPLSRGERSSRKEKHPTKVECFRSDTHRHELPISESGWVWLNTVRLDSISVCSDIIIAQVDKAVKPLSKSFALKKAKSRKKPTPLRQQLQAPYGCTK